MQGQIEALTKTNAELEKKVSFRVENLDATAEDQFERDSNQGELQDASIKKKGKEENGVTERERKFLFTELKQIKD